MLKLLFPFKVVGLCSQLWKQSMLIECKLPNSMRFFSLFNVYHIKISKTDISSQLSVKQLTSPLEVNLIREDILQQI